MVVAKNNMPTIIHRKFVFFLSVMFCKYHDGRLALKLMLLIIIFLLFHLPFNS